MDVSTPNTIHLTLPSNASMERYPENKPQNFTTMLAKPMELTGRWSVALRSIAYPNNSLDIMDNNLLTLIFHVEREIISADISIRDIRVSSLEGLCRYLQRAFFDRLFKDSDTMLQSAIEAGFTRTIPITFSYSEYTMKVKIECTGIEASLDFTYASEIQAMLGIENSMRALPLLGVRPSEANFLLRGSPILSLPIKGSKAATFKAQKPGFFIYTDIIKPHRVGDSFSKLIQYAPFDKDSMIGYKEYINPMYFEIETNIIHTIQIRLCDSSCKDIKFPAGQTNLQL